MIQRPALKRHDVNVRCVVAPDGSADDGVNRDVLPAFAVLADGPSP